MILVMIILLMIPRRISVVYNNLDDRMFFLSTASFFCGQTDQPVLKQGMTECCNCTQGQDDNTFLIMNTRSTCSILNPITPLFIAKNHHVPCLNHVKARKSHNGVPILMVKTTLIVIFPFQRDPKAPVVPPKQLLPARGGPAWLVRPAPWHECSAGSSAGGTTRFLTHFPWELIWSIYICIMYVYRCVTL